MTTASPADQHRIAFGDDGSPGSEAAWGWLIAQSWGGWGVDVISVTDPEPTIESLLTREPLREHQPANPRRAHATTGFGTVRYLTAAADPRLVMSEPGVGDLVVVGARGRGLFKAMHLGSTADWLLASPAVPTVIARQPRAAQRVLACVDGSGHAHAAVASLASMPWIGSTAVSVLAVSERDHDVRPQVDAAAALLEARGAEVSIEVIDRDPRTPWIRPRDIIFEHVDRSDPDLVVLGTKGLTGLTRMRVGSVASAVASGVACTVLLARDPDLDRSL